MQKANERRMYVFLAASAVLFILAVYFLTNSAPAGVSLANPASVYCEQMNYTLKIMTNAQGDQYGLCVFPDGSACDEWQFYRGECTEVRPIVPAP